MYHPINKPDCAPQLEKLMALARATIAFGLENDASIASTYVGDIPGQVALQKRLDASFLSQHGGLQLLAAARAQFIEYFAALGNRRAGEWLWRKPAAIAEPVVRLLVIPLSDKQGILEAYDADVNLEARFSEGHFYDQNTTTASPESFALVRQILLNFYSSILAGSGVKHDILQDSQNLDRQAVLQAFLRANRPLLVCPGCDGSPPSVADGIVRADCDHFFPKTKYPFLTIHPLNLTPYCRDCNQAYKRSKDALDAPSVSSLADIYHPYLRWASDEVQVVVERDSTDGQPHLHLHTNENDQQHVARLNCLNHLLSLESRWDGDLTEARLSAKLQTRLTHATQDERRSGEPPTPGWLEDKLRTIAYEMETFQGTEPGLVPASAYAKWVASDADARADWFDIYDGWHLPKGNSRSDEPGGSYDLS